MFSKSKSYSLGVRCESKENLEIFEADTEDDNKEIRNRPKSPLRKSLKQIYREYCSSTSIHGIQYFGDNKRPLKEKIFWFTIFCLSIFCCQKLTENLYHKWDETPVIVSFSEKTTPVWSIPFPAITICAETKRVLNATEGITYAKFYNRLVDHIAGSGNLTSLLANISDSNLNEFRTLLQICNTQIIEKGMPLLSNVTLEHFDILDKMLPQFKRYFFYCKWFRHFGECDELFSKTYTEEGVCFTFNGLRTKEIYREDSYQYQRMVMKSNLSEQTIFSNRTMHWSLEKGYGIKSGIQTYPTRVLGAGSRAGLFIALQSFKHEVDYACRGPVQGFKVLLHSPDDVPHVSKEFVRIPMGKEVIIAVKPNMITTSAGIAAYHPSRRLCYLSTERNLRYFKVYTQTNCELECLANFTLTKCGCVKFSMPRSLNTPVCTEDKIHCYDTAEDELYMLEFVNGLKDNTTNYRSETKCNCMPACTSLSYNVEISQGSFDLKEMLDAQEDTAFFREYPGSRMSRLSVYFKEHQFITSKRSELYGITDFLANCGGIFGLFMGFSFLSVVELVYYFSLRLWSNLRRNSKE